MALRARMGTTQDIGQLQLRQGGSFQNIGYLFVKDGERLVDPSIPPVYEPIWRFVAAFVPPDTSAVPEMGVLTTALERTGVITPPAGFTDRLEWFVPVLGGEATLIEQSWHRQYRVVNTETLQTHAVVNVRGDETLNPAFVEWEQIGQVGPNRVRVYAQYVNEAGRARNYYTSNEVVVYGGVADGSGGWTAQ